MALSNAVRYDPNANFEVREEDVEYRREGGQSWLARIYHPVGAGPFPVLLDLQRFIARRLAATTGVTAAG